MLAYSIGEFWRDLQIAIGETTVCLLIWFFASRFRRRLALTALRSLETNFMRSLLATLGVLIGVGSVVACMSILEGATNKIIDDFKSLGSNVLYVMPRQASVHGRTVGRAQTLTTDDIPILMRELGDDIEMISPEAMGVAEVKRFKKTEPDTWVIATTPDYFLINAYEAKSGRVFTRSEAGDEGSRIVCLGSKIAEQLFGGEDPVGQMVKIRNIGFRVIGVMEKKGNVGFLRADESVYIPIKSGLKRFLNRKWLDQLTIMAVDAKKLEELQHKVKRVLRVAHRLRLGQENDFRILNQEEALRIVNRVTLIFKVVFYSIAGISLLVGGIGIMNIMLVSVTERTREIGVRMAVGARRGDILVQFLIEALIISLLGGGFGLLLGAMFADLLDKVLQGMFATEITLVVVLASLITALTVGIFSGIYPAFKASRLNPVEALRYE